MSDVVAAVKQGIAEGIAEDRAERAVEDAKRSKIARFLAVYGGTAAFVTSLLAIVGGAFVFGSMSGDLKGLSDAKQSVAVFNATKESIADSMKTLREQLHAEQVGLQQYYKEAAPVLTGAKSSIDKLDQAADRANKASERLDAAMSRAQPLLQEIADFERRQERAFQDLKLQIEAIRARLPK